MTKRILLLHAYLPSMPPIAAAFASQWPAAEVLNILDESLYADVTADGVMGQDVPARVASLLRHAEASRADGVVFTGSTFGPAVDAAKGQLGIPVLKADEAMAEIIASETRPVAILCTARRAFPVIRRNIADKAAAGRQPEIAEVWVEGAKDAITAGDHTRHDHLIAAAIAARGAHEVVALGQLSMLPARTLLPPSAASRVLTGADAAVARMRVLLDE